MTPPTGNAPAPLFSPQARGLGWLLGLLLVLAALALNRGVLGFGFLYLRDDDLNVALNPHLGGLGADRLRWMFTDWTYARRYMPLGWLGFSATYEFAGLDPRPYHLVSLALYAANACLLYAVTLRALRVFAGSCSGGLSPWAVGSAFLASAWWAMHPFRVETTAWISGNLYGQATALALASALLYLESYGALGGRRGVLVALSALFYAASLLTYPIALGLPILLVGMDLLRAAKGPVPGLRRLLAEKVAFFLPLAVVLTVTVAARLHTEVFGPVPGLRELPLFNRAAQSAFIAVYYLWKPLWPANLSPLYDTLVGFDPRAPVFLLSIAVVIALSAAALASLRGRPWAAVLWVGYLACAAPFFGITERLHMASDRYGCLLTAIEAVAAALLLVRISPARGRTLAALAALAVLAALALQSFRQLGVWSNDRVQHAYVAAHLRSSELLDDFTGRQLILEFMRGDEAKASAELAERLKANPGSPGLRKAAELFAEKRRLSGYYGDVSLLAIAQEQMALSFARSGQFREADDHFLDAIRMDDRFYQAAYDRALVLLRLGRPDDALRSFLLSERWAKPPLSPTQRREFIGRLRSAAAEQGLPALARAAELAGDR